MSPKKDTQKSAKSGPAIDQKSKRFTEEEQAVMKARAKELKAEARANQKKEVGEKDVLEKIAEMPEPDRTMATRIPAIITRNAPSLWPKTWYGMPAYASDGKVVCHCQSSDKFKTQYSTLGFSDSANLDDGAMRPAAFALKELNAPEEERIVALVVKAVG